MGWLVVAFSPELELLLEVELLGDALLESAGITVRVRCPAASPWRIFTRVPTLTLSSMVAPWFVSSNVRVCPSSVRIASVFPGSYCVTVPVICSVVGFAADEL